VSHFVRVPNTSAHLLFEPGGALGEASPMEQNALKAEAAKLAEVFQRSSSNVEGRNGTSRCATINCEDSTTPESEHA